MARFGLRDFRGGWWAMGPKDATPATTLRRAKAVSALTTASVFSRWGSTQLYALNAHSLYRFGSVRFQGVGTAFYRAGVSIKSGLNGNRLSFVRMPPSISVADSLFVAGGGDLFKVDLAGAVTKWGIAAPPDGFAGALISPKSLIIDNFEDVATWTAVGCTLADETTIVQSGKSMKMSVSAQATGTATKAITVDLTNYGTAIVTASKTLTPTTGSLIVTGQQPSTNILRPATGSLALTGLPPTVSPSGLANITPGAGVLSIGGQTPTMQVSALTTESPLEDYIAIWVRVDNPSNLASMKIEFDVGAGDFSRDYYSYPVGISSEIPPATQLSEQTIGLGTITEEQQVILFVGGSEGQVDNISTIQQIQRSLGQTTLTTALGAWVRLRIPKSIFVRNGTSDHTFANVVAVRLTATANANGPIIVYWDILELSGSTGLQGTYKYKVTFRNSVTGSRSNANPTFVKVEGSTRQAISLTGLPTSSDPQVNAREIWRTVGGGTLFFKIDEIADNSTTTYVDRIADFAGLDSLPGARVMTNTQLPTDNLPPNATYNHAFGPFLATMFWCADTATGAKGRVYFSPSSRPESVSGFLVVTNDDDPTQCGLIWNGSAYVFTQGHLFQIDGSTGIFVSREVFGAPGTTDPKTVCGTPIGIFYQAKDGLRLFDGITSVIVGDAQFGGIYRGETIEGVAPFEGIVASYSKSEYIVSSGSETLAVNLARRTWRYLGVGLNAIFYEPDTGLVIASLAGKTVILEDNTIPTDNGVAIPFEIEVPSVITDVEHTNLIQRLYIEANTAGQLLTPTVIIDGVEFVLPPFQTASRTTVEFPLLRNGRVAGVRLTGSLTQRVEIVGVEFDIYQAQLAIERTLQTIQQVTI